MKKLILISVLIVLSSCNKVKTNVYVAKLNQKSLENPSVKVIEDRKIKVDWVRSGEGIYFGNFSGVNTENVNISISNPANLNHSISYTLNENQIQVYTSILNEGNYTLSDGVMIDIDFKLTEFK